MVPPDRSCGKGRPAKDNRMMINAIIWILKTEAPWLDLPERYGRGTAHTVDIPGGANVASGKRSFWSCQKTKIVDKKRTKPGTWFRGSSCKNIASINFANKINKINNYMH